MSLKETLHNDLMVHLKARNTMETSTLRNVLGEIGNAEKAGKTSTEFNDTQIVTLLSREVNKRLKTAAEYETAGVKARAEQETLEATFLQTYLPQPLTEAEIASLIAEEAERTGATTMRDMGALMKAVTARTTGRADGKTVVALVRNHLS